MSRNEATALVVFGFFAALVLVDQVEPQWLGGMLATATMGAAAWAVPLKR